MARPKVLVVRLGAFGDVAMALVALRALRRGLPDATISWLVERRHAPVLAGSGDLDEIIALAADEWRRAPLGVSTVRDVIADVRALRRRRFDVALDLQGLTKSALWVRASGAPLRVGLPPGWLRERVAALAVNARPRPLEGSRHVVEAFVAAADEVVERLGGTRRPGLEAGWPPEHVGLVALADDETAWAAAVVDRHPGTPIVVLSPGAAWVTKLWPSARYGEVARRLAADLGVIVLVAHGPSEAALAAEVVAAAAAPSVVGLPCDLRQLAAMLDRAALFVGADSGPFHLAQRLGTPAVALFGPTDPRRNGSLEPADRVLWERPACSPCYGRTCPTEVECMQAISVSAVVAACRDRIGRRGG